MSTALVNHFKDIDQVQTHQKHTLAVKVAKNLVPKDGKQTTKVMGNGNKLELLEQTK